MKPHPALRSFLILAGSVPLGISLAQAQLTWDSNNTGAGQTNGAGAWLGTNQWWDGANNTDWVSGSDAIFGVANTAGGAVTLASPTTVESFTFNQFSGTYTLGTAGQAITLNSGITKNASSAAVTFVGPITLGGAQTWTNNSTGTLTTANGANLITNGGFDLTVGGTGNTTFGVVNNDASSLTGAGNLIKNGPGVLTLGGVNAGFTGNVTVNGGTLRVTKPTSINGNLNLTNGVYEHYWSDAYTRTLGAGAGQIQITGGTSGFSENGATSATFTLNNNAAFEVVWGSEFFNPSTFVLQADTAQGTSSLTLANKIDLAAADRVIQVSGGTTGGARATISGQIRTSSGTAGLTKTGAGYLALSNGANAWNGSTVITGGILDLAGMTNANLGGGSGRNVTVAAGAAVRFNAASNTLLNRLVETADEIGIMTGATANNLDFSGSAGANLPNAFLGNWAGNGAKAEFSGIITPASDNYRLGAKGSSGLLGIVGTNKLTGSQGLIVGGTGGSGIRVELAAAQNFTGETVITTGAKLTLGNNLALQNSALNLGSAGGTFALSTGTNAGRISGDVAAPSPTFGGLKGSRNLYAAFTSAGGNNESLLVNTAVIGFTLNVGTGLTHTYSGAIGGFGTGASGGLNGASTLTKTGAGTQILTGTSTYNGVTTITGGTLSIDGAGSINNSDVTVDGGTFRYNSSVAYSKTLTFTSGAVAGTNLTGSLGGITIGSGQTLSPGNSPGTAETTSQTWAGGGSYLWEINNATGTAGADPGWDLLTGTGTLDITASAATPFNILVTSLTLANVGGDAANFNPLSSYNWMIADFVDPVTGFAADAFNVNATGFTNPGATGSFSVVRGDAVGGDDTQVYLTYVPVPEPSATVLLGLGALALLRRRRRR